MKKLLIILFIASGLISCKSNGDTVGNALTGTYKLSETLIDIGDGSGTYNKVKSDKTIEFHKDGTVTSNGELCFMRTETKNPSSGTYSISEKTITADNCEKLSFTLEGKTLTINYPCIEPCGAKFKKI